MTNSNFASSAAILYSGKDMEMIEKLDKINFLDIADLAKMFNVCIKTIHNWRKKGNLPLKRFPNSNKYFISDVELYALMLSGKLPLIQDVLKSDNYGKF